MRCPRCNQALSRADVARLLSSLRPAAPNRKLSDEQRQEIRQRKPTATAKELAKEYDVSVRTIYAVWQERT